MNYNVLLASILIMVLSCNQAVNSEEEYDSLKADSIEEATIKEDKEESEIILDTTFIKIFSAEIAHQFTIPNNIKSIESPKYDSLIYLYPDSSLLLKKWVYHNYLNTHNYPKDEYGDIKANEVAIDSLLIYFENRAKAELKFEKDIDPVRVEDSNLFQKLAIGEKDGRRIAKKLMFCDVVGGTHAIVILELEYSPIMSGIVDEILIGTSPRMD